MSEQLVEHERGVTLAPRSLPVSLVDPADVIALVPGTSPEDAERYGQIATMSVTAAIWPCDMPAAPLPAPLYATLLAISARLAASGGQIGGTVQSESLGSYSYSKRAAETVRFGLTQDELDAIEPWSCQKSVLTLDVGAAFPTWPVDWWQRDYDNAIAYADDVVAQSGATE